LENGTTTIETSLEDIVNRMMDRCMEYGQYRQALGVAIETKRLDVFNAMTLVISTLRMYSQERRRDRYMCILIWKSAMRLVSGYKLGFINEGYKAGPRMYCCQH